MLSVARNIATFFDLTRTKPGKTLEDQLTKAMESFLIDKLLSLKDKERMFCLTSLKVSNSVSETTE